MRKKHEPVVTSNRPVESTIKSTKIMENEQPQEVGYEVAGTELALISISTDLVLPTQALERENLTEKVLSELEERARGLTINGAEDKAGYNLVRGTRLEAKGLRNRTVKVCKLGREDAVKVQKAWLAAEKKITKRLDDIEAPLQAEENRINSIVEAERKAREEATFKRVTDRVSAFAAVGITMDFVDARDMSDDEYADTLASATFIFEGEQEKARVIAEAEAARIEEERVEAERIAKAEAERVEAARLEAESKAKADAEELERGKEELRKMQEEMAEERRAMAFRQEAIAAQNAKIEQDAAAARIIEQTRIDAERAEKERIEREALSAAQAPDKDKLQSLAQDFRSYPLPEMATPVGKEIMITVSGLLEKVAVYITNKASAL